MTQTTESGINGGLCCYRKHSMGPQAGAAACKCYCHKNGAPRTWNGRAIQAPNIPAPKPAAIVAECWTCAYVGHKDGCAFSRMGGRSFWRQCNCNRAHAQAAYRAIASLWIANGGQKPEENPHIAKYSIFPAPRVNESHRAAGHDVREVAR